MTETINIPIRLIKGYKRDKVSLEMIACAVIIKHKYQNSCLYDLKITSVMELFGVSHKKAQKLLKSLREHELFIYNKKKDCLFAKSFKSKDSKVYGKRKKYDAVSDYCRKLKVKDGMKLRELVKQLRYTLLLNVINASGQDDLNNSRNKTVCHETNATRVIQQRIFAGSISMSKSSASRYINDMVETKEVSKTPIVAECVIPVLNDETASEYLERTHRRFFALRDEKNGIWSGWNILGRAYSIIDRTLSDSFLNVIYNYKYPCVLQARTSSELDGKWKN